MSREAYQPSGNGFKAYGKMVDIHLSKRTNEGGSYRQPVEWNPSLEAAVVRSFMNAERPLRIRLGQISVGDPDIDLELQRFAVKLDAYFDSPNPLMSYKEIVGLAARGPEGASILKKIKAKSVWKTFGTLPWEEDLKIISYPSYRFRDIGDIFNYQYLPFWKESEDPEDYKESLHSCNPQEWALSFFRDTFMSLLPDDIPVVKEKEILLLNRGSSSYTPQGKKATTPVFLGKQTSANTMGNSISGGLRCLIPKCPGDTRDAVILTLPSSNRVSWIDAQSMEVLAQMDHHIHLRSNRDIEKRISKMGKKSSHFVHRDLKKEGLTKPRVLLKIMLEALKQKYPHAKAYDKTDFYEDFHLVVDGVKIFPKRGHGLGMANCLTTFMNITIFFMSMNLENDEFIAVQGMAQSLSLNDDFLAGFDTFEDASSYIDREKYIMDELSLIYHPTKSFVSEDKFVIAEEYFPRSLSEKESFKRAEVLQSLVCSCIGHAKNQINSQVNHKTMAYWEQYKAEIVSYWGYEFYPEECQLPYSCGGWVSDVLLGVNLDLIKLDQLPYNRKVYAAFKAAQTPPPRIRGRKDKKVYQSPYLRIWGNLKVSDYLKSHLDVGYIGDIKAKYTTFFRNPKKALKAWIEFSHKRDFTYKKYLKEGAPPFSVFVQEWISCTDSDFYPLEDMVESYLPFGVRKERREIDPYSSPNPLLSAVCEENPHIDFTEIGEHYSILKKYNSSSLVNFSKLDWQKVNEEKLLTNWGSMFEWNPEWIIPQGNHCEMQRFSECYINPINMANICHMLGERKLPILKPQFKDREILKARNNVYKNTIPVSIYPEISLSKISRGDLASLISCEGLSWDDIKSILEEYNSSNYDELHKPPPIDEYIIEGEDIEAKDLFVENEKIRRLTCRSNSDYLKMLWLSIKVSKDLSRDYGSPEQRRAAQVDLTNEDLLMKLRDREKLSLDDVAMLREFILSIEEDAARADEDELQAATWSDSLWGD